MAQRLSPVTLDVEGELRLEGPDGPVILRASGHHLRVDVSSSLPSPGSLPEALRSGIPPVLAGRGLRLVLVDGDRELAATSGPGGRLRARPVALAAWAIRAPFSRVPRLLAWLPHLRASTSSSPPTSP